MVDTIVTTCIMNPKKLSAMISCSLGPDNYRHKLQASSFGIHYRFLTRTWEKRKPGPQNYADRNSAVIKFGNCRPVSYRVCVWENSFDNDVTENGRSHLLVKAQVPEDDLFREADGMRNAESEW